MRVLLRCGSAEGIVASTIVIDAIFQYLTLAGHSIDHNGDKTLVILIPEKSHLVKVDRTGPKTPSIGRIICDEDSVYVVSYAGRVVISGDILLSDPNMLSSLDKYVKEITNRNRW